VAIAGDRDVVEDDFAGPSRPVIADRRMVNPGVS
jgi:hypothetical protein